MHHSGFHYDIFMCVPHSHLLPIWLIPSSSQLHCIHVFGCPFFPSLCDPVSFIKVAYKA